MANIKTYKLVGVLLSLLLFLWGILPFLRHQPITAEVIASAIILIMISFAYLIIMFNPSWTKAVFFFEGIIIAVSGYMLLAFPYNLELLGVGLIVIIIAVLAYLGKLPPKLLKWFYK